MGLCWFCTNNVLSSELVSRILLLVSIVKELEETHDNRVIRAIESLIINLPWRKHRIKKR